MKEETLRARRKLSSLLARKDEENYQLQTTWKGTSYTTSSPQTPKDNGKFVTIALQPSAAGEKWDAKSSVTRNGSGNIKDYEFIKLIQQGGCGAVYLAKDKASGQKFAIKVLKKTTEKMTTLARKEAATMLKLRGGCKHIVQIREVIENEDTIYLVMQWGIGGDLFEYVDNRKKVDEGEIWRMFEQVVNAVDFAHQLGVIHRDIKPENIFLDKDSNVLLGDWGHAGRWSAGKRKRKFWGTMHYCAPELLRAQSYIGPEVDVFALGVLLYILLTGRAPFGEEKNSTTLKRILAGDWIRDKSLDPSVEDLLNRLYKVDPQERATLDDVKKFIARLKLRKEGSLEELEAALYLEACNLAG